MHGSVPMALGRRVGDRRYSTKENTMSEKTRPFVAVVLVLCIALGLSSPMRADEYGDAKKAYQSGQNEAALSLLLVKLRKDNSHQDAIALYKTVLKLVIDKHQTA